MTALRADAQMSGGIKGEKLNATPNTYAGSQFSHKAVANKNGSWGYEISVDGKPYIRQTTVPGAPGTRGYATKEEAEVAARKEVDRIKGTAAESSGR